MCGRSVEAGAATGVLDLEELCGPGEKEAHHPHVAGEAGQVQGRVAAWVAPRRHVHLGLVQHRPHHVL